MEAGRRAGAGWVLGRPRQTSAGRLGEQLGTGAGNSLEFMDYREYTPGDDLRRIDWSAYARSDRLAVKLYREEISPHLDLLVDVSGSMDLPGTAKGEATLGLAAALATAADHARVTRRVYAAGLELRWIQGSDGGVEGWPAWRFDERAALGAAVRDPAVPLRRRGIRVLISDLLCEDDPWPIVTRLAENASAAWVLQVLTRQDVDPAWSGDLRLIDRETRGQRELRLDAAAVQRYRVQLDRLREQWRAACRRAGIGLIELVAEELVAGWDLSDLSREGLLVWGGG